jgi:hypothetical protein
MAHLIEGVGHLLMWLVEHNLRQKVEIIIRVRSNTEMYAGNDALRRGEPPEGPVFLMDKPIYGTTVCGIPVCFEVEPYSPYQGGRFVP